MRFALAAALCLLSACPPPQPPPTPPPPPPPPDAGPPPLAADGAACTAAAECQSGICEGEGCHDAKGVCAPRARACTKDLRPYCGCDGVTFRTSGSCPGRRFAFRGACEDGPPDDPEPGKAADGAACTTAADCQSGICEGQGCDPGQGLCASKQRACTMDYRPYCGCDGKTFHGSGGCPNRRYAHRGDCKVEARLTPLKITVTAVIGSHDEVNRQVEALIAADARLRSCPVVVKPASMVIASFKVESSGALSGISVSGADGLLERCAFAWARDARFRPPVDAQGRPGKATLQVTLRFDPV